MLKIKMDIKAAKRITKNITLGTLKAIEDTKRDVGKDILFDIALRMPRVPVDTASLARSGSLFVNGKLIRTTEDLFPSLKSKYGKRIRKPNPPKTFPDKEGIIIAWSSYDPAGGKGYARAQDFRVNWFSKYASLFGTKGIENKVSIHLKRGLKKYGVT